MELSEKGEFLLGIIRIGIVETSAMRILTREMQKFTAQYPHVHFEIYSADSDDLKRSMDENKLDLAILLEPVESAKYDKTSIPAKDRRGLVVRKADFPSDRKEMPFSEVVATPLILPRRFIVLEEISSWLKVSDKDLKVTAYHNLPSNALDLVSSGMGALLCVEGSFTNRSKSGLRFVPITPERVSGHVAVKKKNRPIAKAAAIFWETLCALDSAETADEVLKKLGGRRTKSAGL